MNKISIGKRAFVKGFISMAVVSMANADLARTSAAGDLGDRKVIADQGDLSGVGEEISLPSWLHIEEIPLRDLHHPPSISGALVQELEKRGARVDDRAAEVKWGRITVDENAPGRPKRFLQEKWGSSSLDVSIYSIVRKADGEKIGQLTQAKDPSMLSTVAILQPRGNDPGEVLYTTPDGHVKRSVPGERTRLRRGICDGFAIAAGATVGCALRCGPAGAGCGIVCGVGFALYCTIMSGVKR